MDSIFNIHYRERLLFYIMIKAFWLKIISLVRHMMRDLNQRATEFVEYHDVHSSALMCQARPSTLHIGRQSTVIRTVTSVVKQILNGAGRAEQFTHYASRGAFCATV